MQHDLKQICALNLATKNSGMSCFSNSIREVTQGFVMFVFQILENNKTPISFIDKMRMDIGQAFETSLPFFLLSQKYLTVLIRH